MRKLVAVMLGGALWLAGAPAALAHVTVDPREATRGGFATFDVRVPDERSDASTTKVELLLPEDRPIASVSVQPVPGWTYAVARRHLSTPLTDDDGNKIEDVVSTITWTAASGGGIKPGEFAEFPVSMGPLPDDAARLVFKTNQTYDSGEVVRWIEVPEEGKPEPEHPAPVVTLVGAAGGEDQGAATAPAAPAGPAAGGSTSASGRATAALVVALIAAALAIAAMTAGRSKQSTAPAGVPEAES